MKKIVVLVLLGLFVMPMVAMAEDGRNIIDQISDVATGHNDFVPTYGSYELCKELATEKIPVMNMLPFGIGKGITQIGAEIKARLGDGLLEEGEFTWKVRNIF